MDDPVQGTQVPDQPEDGSEPEGPARRRVGDRDEERDQADEDQGNDAEADVPEEAEDAGARRQRELAERSAAQFRTSRPSDPSTAFGL